MLQNRFAISRFIFVILQIIDSSSAEKNQKVKKSKNEIDVCTVASKPVTTLSPKTHKAW